MVWTRSRLEAVGSPMDSLAAIALCAMDSDMCPWLGNLRERFGAEGVLDVFEGTKLQEKASDFRLGLYVMRPIGWYRNSGAMTVRPCAVICLCGFVS